MGPRASLEVQDPFPAHGDPIRATVSNLALGNLGKLCTVTSVGPQLRPDSSLISNSVPGQLCFCTNPETMPERTWDVPHGTSAWIQPLGNVSPLPRLPACLLPDLASSPNTAHPLDKSPPGPCSVLSMGARKKSPPQRAWDLQLGFWEGTGSFPKRSIETRNRGALLGSQSLAVGFRILLDQKLTTPPPNFADHLPSPRSLLVLKELGLTTTHQSCPAHL